MTNLARALALLSLALFVASCGDSGTTAEEPPAQARHAEPTDPDGPDGPLPARSNEVNLNAETAGRGAQAPCSLVSRGQAQDILGGSLQKPVEAAQGPTCIFRSNDGKRFVTLAVQTRDVDALTRQVKGRQPMEVGSRDGFCSVQGQPTLYVPLTADQVLTVTAPCLMAEELARRALRRLER
jgi:hypothetical protein